MDEIISNKRKLFLEAYLGALGAEKIIWGNVTQSEIFGTVIYDINKNDESQNFVWEMDENNVPNDNVIRLIDFLSKNNFIECDKIITPISEIEIPFFENDFKNDLLNQLTNISVRMIDNGNLTDYYYFHF